MHAKDLALNARRQRQPVEQRVDPLPRQLPLVNPKPLLALGAKAKERVDVSRLVVSWGPWVNDTTKLNKRRGLVGWLQGGVGTSA